MHLEHINLILFSVYSIIAVIPNCIVNCVEMEGGYKFPALASFIVVLHMQCASTRHKINVVKTKQFCCSLLSCGEASWSAQTGKTLYQQNCRQKS